MESIKGCGWDIESYGEHCMTPKFMYHRAMITVDRPIDSYL